MNYNLEIFYAQDKGQSHTRVTESEMFNLVGYAIGDRVMSTVNERMSQRTIPQVTAFFERGGRQVVLANLTNRGNIYIEAVEVM